MPQYAILRVTKHKTVQNLVSSLKHNFREIPTHNANPEMTKNNGHFSMKSQALANNEDEPINTTSKAMDIFNRRIEQIARNGKIRSNAVLAEAMLYWLLSIFLLLALNGGNRVLRKYEGNGENELLNS